MHNAKKNFKVGGCTDMQPSDGTVVDVNDLVPTDDSPPDLASWLHGLGLSTNVLPLLEGEGIKVKSDLIGIEKSEFRSIGINLGDANKITRKMSDSE